MNLTTTNQISSEALTYAPIALSAVQGIETSLASTPGATKSEIAVNIVLAAATAAEGVPIPAVSAIASLVALLVNAANAFGVFKHKAKPQAPPPPVNLGMLNASGSGGIAAAAIGTALNANGTGQQPAPLSTVGFLAATSGFIAPAAL